MEERMMEERMMRMDTPAHHQLERERLLEERAQTHWIMGQPAALGARHPAHPHPHPPSLSTSHQLSQMNAGATQGGAHHPHNFARHQHPQVDTPGVLCSCVSRARQTRKIMGG